MAADGSVYGIVAPHGTEGPRAWLLELQGVAYSQLVPDGATILTSGLGGVLPRGIPLGTVLGVAGGTRGGGGPDPPPPRPPPPGAGPPDIPTRPPPGRGLSPPL